MNMDKEYAVELLTQFISVLIKQADREIQYAQETKSKALLLLKELEQISASLTSQDCPFCPGAMINTTPLKPLVDKASKSDPTGYQFETAYFGWMCQHCHTYQTVGDVHSSALRWSRTSNDIKRSKSKIFATEVFSHCDFIDEVVRERPVGRGWMFRVGTIWYANSAEKQTIRELWNLG